MTDRPNRPLTLVARILVFIAEACLVLIAGVGTGAAVYWLVEVLR